MGEHRGPLSSYPTRYSAFSQARRTLSQQKLWGETAARVSHDLRNEIVEELMPI